MSTKAKSVDVLLVQRAGIGFFPPIMNQANLLQEAGLTVVVLDGSSNGLSPGLLNCDIRKISTHVASKKWAAIEFARVFSRALRELKPRVCIAYDQPAACLLGMRRFSGKKVFHFHEYPGGDEWGRTTWLSRIYSRIAIHYSKKIKQVIFADSHRASSFYREHGLPRLPSVLRNCPRRLEFLPEGILRSKLVSMGMDFRHIVLFQGSVSTNLYVDNIVDSMRYWPPNAIMVFVGPVAEDVKIAMKHRVTNSGLENAVMFLGQVPYSEILKYTVDASVSMTMIKPVTFNYMHMAGASNKRYEAMACGIPQISNEGPGMKELIVDNGVGVCVDADDVKAIGDAVRSLLQADEKRGGMSRAARALHLHRFNYESEFASQLRIIREWCGRNENTRENTRY